VALEAVQLFDGNGYIVRVSSRAALPGRQGASDLRRHRWDSGFADRPQPDVGAL